MLPLLLGELTSKLVVLSSQICILTLQIANLTQ
jgi:hypothetical protein